MTTIALTDEVRNKLGMVNKWINFINSAKDDNSNESLGQTISKVLDDYIKNYKIKIPQ